VLVSFSLDANGQQWPVRFGRTALGAGADCEIVLARPGVSTRHAEVMVRDNKGVPKIWLSDNNSTNGTKLNGEDIFTERPDLHHGDEVTIAGLVFTFIALPNRATA
jgi:pSer/pThr/pTyr-binding forkhead associated (FHA) protein